ncbi:MAG: dTDP-glucose 4,6-dehydratase, partial [bacterium]
VRGICSILESGKNGEVYHFATAGLTIRNLVEKICGKMNRDFNSSVEITSERVGKDSFYGLDSSKSKKELNWEAQITLDESIDEVIAWINERWDEILKYPVDYIHQE